MNNRNSFIVYINISTDILLVDLHSIIRTDRLRTNNISELVWRTVFYTRVQAKRAIARYIDGFYNLVRRHSALDYTSPARFERTASR